MHKTLASLLVLVLLPLLSVAQETPQPLSLNVMTFNLRFASNQKPNAWPDRRPVMAALLKEYNPDIVGTQEGVYHQLKDIASDLPSHDWIGLGRLGGSRGEFMAIYYRKDRFEPMEYDHYWLSDTPDVIASKGWGNNIPRMVTWVRFREKSTKQEFYFVNTHFDHQSQPAREKSAELVRKRVEELKTELPVILLGDFNAAAGNNRAYSTLTEGGFFADTWESARQKKGQTDIGTFHNYRGAVKDGARIDWIHTRGAVQAESTEIITFSQNSQHPSDHFPVAATLKLAQAAPRQ